MTLREEFENYINSWNKLSVETLFMGSNKEYIKWLEDKYQNDDCDCSDKPLEDYDESEIVGHLKSTNFDFIEEVNTSEMIDYLGSTGHTIIRGDFIPKDEELVDHNDLIRLDEIRTKFLDSSWAEREKIYSRIMKNENFHDYNRMDMFDYLDQTGFDFLDNIDSQEIISHLEGVGYDVIIENK